MGERLGIGIYKNKKLLAASYYHWGGYADTALELLHEVVSFLDCESISNYKDETLYAIRALEETGAALDESNLMVANELYSNEKFENYVDRNEGFIGLEDDAKRIMTATNECIEIDLDKEEIYFGSIGYYDVKKKEGNYIPIDCQEDISKYVKQIIKENKKNMVHIHKDIDPEHLKFDQIDALEELLEEAGNEYFTIDSQPKKLYYVM